MGRPKALALNDTTLARLEALGRKGLTNAQIAASMGVATSTIQDYISKYPEFSDAIKKGKEKGIANVANALYQKAMGGDNTAMIFFLKNRDPDNWRDIKSIEAKIDHNHTHESVSETDRWIEDVIGDGQSQQDKEPVSH